VIFIRGGAELIALAASALAAVIVIRDVGPGIAGSLALTTTLLYLAAVVVGGGMPSLGAQLVATSPQLSRPTFRKAFLVRFGYATAWFVVMESILAVTTLEEPLHQLLVWTAPGAFLVALRNEWFLVGRGAVGAVALVRAISALVGLAVAFLVVQGSVQVAGLVVYVLSALAVAAIASTCLALMRLGPKTGAAGSDDLSSLRSFARSGFHYLKADAAIFVNNNSDRLFLYAFGGAAVTGLYDAAYKLIQPFAAISSVVGDSMFLSLAQIGYGIDHHVTFRRFVDWMFVATVPVGFVTLGFGDSLVEAVYGVPFHDAGPLLAILGWVVTVGYLSGVLAIPFSAWHAPRAYGNSVLAGGLANLALNISLIPAFLGIGAALATVGARLAVVLAAIRPFRNLSDYPVLTDFSEYCLASGAALAVAAGSTALFDAPWFVGLTLFGAAYAPLVFVLRFRPAARSRRRLPGNS
jgi:O-antigen/teichoic acid export membrane protein